MGRPYTRSYLVLVKKAIKKNFSGGMNKKHEAMGSTTKHQEVSDGFRRCQEASESIREAKHLNKKLKKNTVALKPKEHPKKALLKCTVS